MSGFLFPQDYEEAILLLLEGTVWDEALRLVRSSETMAPFKVLVLT